jgi:subtilisin family serine protease
VGDNYYGQEFYPDPDPMDVEGHGTHVAGIVAASNDDNFVSVAPDVSSPSQTQESLNKF